MESTIFLHTMDADAVFPMHLWGRYDLIPQYKKELILAGEPELAKRLWISGRRTRYLNYRYY